MADTRVTIIDDDRDSVDLFRELLEFLDGFEISSFVDALPGLHELIGSKPDLILIDLAVPFEREQLSGLQVVHSARSTEELRDVPIVVSYTVQADMDAAWAGFMERGDVQQLAKPFDLDTFARVVNMALARPMVGPQRARLHATDEERGEVQG